MTSRPPPTAQVLADAAARRHTSTEASTPSAQLIDTQEHEKRQMFRRLIEPGIFRPNSKEIAMGSLKVSVSVPVWCLWGGGGPQSTSRTSALSFDLKDLHLTL